MKELELGMKNLVFEIKYDLSMITIKELIEKIKPNYQLMMSNNKKTFNRQYLNMY